MIQVLTFLKLSQWNQHLLQSNPALLELWNRLSTLLKLLQWNRPSTPYKLFQLTFLELFQWNPALQRTWSSGIHCRRSLNCRRSQSSPSRHFKSGSSGTRRSWSCSTARTTAVPHTSTALTTKDPEKSSSFTKSTIFTTTPWLHVEEQVD